MTPSQILWQASWLVLSPGKWTKHSPAKDAHGSPVDPNSPEATCWCAIGAIYKTGGNCPESSDAADLLRSFLYKEGLANGISEFNDQSRQHASRVSAVMRSAAQASAKPEEANLFKELE